MHASPQILSTRRRFRIALFVGALAATLIAVPAAVSAHASSSAPSATSSAATGSAAAAGGPAAVHYRAACPDTGSGAHCQAQVILDAHGNVYHQKKPTPGVPIALASGAVGYSPAQIHGAYALPWNSGYRQTIAVVDAYDHPNANYDLNTFDTYWGLGTFPTCSASVTVACFQRVNQGGTASGFTNSNQAAANQWEIETAMDVEAAHMTCLNCKILLVEAYTDAPGDLATSVNVAAQLGATEISNSYGWAESGLATWYPTAYSHAGIAITASAHDHGYGAYYPADLNTVVAVGGTALRLNSNGSYQSETAWGNGVSSPSGAGTGSGCSTFTSAYTSAAYWQKSVANWSYTGCGTQRSIADVSALADPMTGMWVYSYNNGGWIIEGGTSLSAPIIAGVYGLAGNAATTTFPGLLLYQHSNSLRDVTTGSNGSCSYYVECHGYAGYDGPTGLGTPYGVGAF